MFKKIGISIKTITIGLFKIVGTESKEFVNFIKAGRKTK